MHFPFARTRGFIFSLCVLSIPGGLFFFLSLSLPTIYLRSNSDISDRSCSDSRLPQRLSYQIIQRFLLFNINIRTNFVTSVYKDIAKKKIIIAHVQRKDYHMKGIVNFFYIHLYYERKLLLLSCYSVV